jgi:hypothetical protein
MSRWVVLHEHTVAVSDVRADGGVGIETFERWIASACDEYLGHCHVLRSMQGRDHVELQREIAGLSSAVVRDVDPRVAVSATAAEVWPDSFRISLRIRPNADSVINASCTISLVDTRTGDRAQLGNAVRDELIALEHAARHMN